MGRSLPVAQGFRGGWGKGLVQELATWLAVQVPD